MARETFGTLLLTAQNYCVDDTTTNTVNNLSTSKVFLRKEINNCVRNIFATLKNYKTQIPPKTAATVEDQQFYHYPPGVRSIESATLLVGSVYYPLQVIDSQTRWDNLNQITVSGSTTPQFIFPRRDDFGIWPVPAADDDTITLNVNPMPKDMTIDDYETGTVSCTQNDATVTGASTVFTSTMVGRWFKSVTDQEWYRITTFTSTTSLELESVFEGAAVATDTYLIGESPEIPEEFHSLIPWFAAGMYMAGPRRETETGQKYLNFFYTGDFDNNTRDIERARGGLLYFLNEYKGLGRGSSPFVYRGKRGKDNFSEIWSSTLE